MKIPSHTTLFKPLIAAAILAITTLPVLLLLPEEPGNRGSDTILSPAGDALPLQQGVSTDSVFRATLARAEAFCSNKEYEKCLAELQKAQQMRPADPQVKARINEVKGLAASSREQRETAEKAIASGDAYFKAKDYLNAKSAYQLAVTTDPANAAAKEKLKTTMDLLRSQKAQNILFDVAVAGADKLFQAGEYDKALQEYEKASRMLPSDPYPKNRMNEIIKIQVDAKVKEEEYGKAIAKADQSLEARKLADALISYKQAASIKPEEKYPQDKIREVTALLAKQKEIDEAYGKAIALADQSFNASRYGDALKSYTDASVIKPAESYPKNRIREIEGIMARKASTQAEYDKFITLADSAYIGKNYFQARDNYMMALSVKPGEAYPKEMIAKAEKMLTGQEAAMAKALDEQFARTVASADKLFGEQSYELAREEYTKASNLKPSEQYPKEKIAEIGTLLANALKDKEERYAKAIAAGDRALKEKAYETARNEYQAALLIKPGESYPTGKLAELDKLAAAEAGLKAADARYANAIGKADSLFLAKAYLASKSEFQRASGMKPEEVYPKNRIVEINMILYKLEEQKKLDLSYATTVEKADKLLASNSLAQAKAEYEKALTLKPDETYPKEKLALIGTLLADATAKKELDDRYASAVTAADRLLAEKKYDPAREGYSNALAIKPGEKYPQDKIAEIDRVLADLAAQKSLEERYRAGIAAADSLFAGKDYTGAKSGYAAASALKPAEKYPKERIAEIDRLLAEMTRLQELEAGYTAAVAEGDRLFGEKAWALSKEKYQAALRLKPAEQHPKDQITLIDKALAELAALKDRDDRYAASVGKADNLLGQKQYDAAKAEYSLAGSLKPEEAYPKQKIAEIDAALQAIAAAKALDEQYRAAVGTADRLFAEKQYGPSKQEYENALKIKPEEQYPKDRVAEIDRVMAEIAAARSLEENYQALVAAGDRLLGEKNYEGSKKEFTAALALKPTEKYPQQKIGEIDGILAAIAQQKLLDEQFATAVANGDRLMGEKQYSEAKSAYTEALRIKPAELYPKERITEADKALADIAAARARDEQYDAAVAAGDRLLAEKTYGTARAEYEKALGIKPGEAYPKEKIREIEAALAALAAAKALDEQYAGAVAEADRLFAAKTWKEARSAYENAAKLKPAETYPGVQIAAIDKTLAEVARQQELDRQYAEAVANGDRLLAAKNYEQARTGYTAAAQLKPEEQYPKQKIGEIDGILEGLARQKALDESYAAAVAAGDRLLGEKSYEAAKTEYAKASELKPGEAYPKEKLSEIDRAVAEVARLKAIDDRYREAVEQADRLLAEKSYDQAKTAYAGAGQIKPSEQYPKEKIAEIDGILAEMARLKTLDDQYRATVAKADQFFNDKIYESAKGEYAAASVLKPAEQYPKDRIAEIDGILAALKAQEEAYNKAVASADALFGQKKYEEARTGYQEALAVKPSALYPKEKIAEINRALEELMGKQKYYEKLVAQADEALKIKDYIEAKESYQQASNVFPSQAYPKDQIAMITARMDSLYRANKALYDKAVADGDRAFNNFEFDKAIDAYTEAANFLPMEKYPREQIVKIRRTIAENAIVDVLNSPVTITSMDEKQFKFTPVNIASRKNNFVYIKIKNLSGKPFNVMMRYGKDGQANGGVVMRNLNPDGKVAERLVSVRDQDVWSREDNNWISLYPQGGDVEVSFIQISRAK